MDINWPELIGAAFGLICVALTVRQNVWCWPTGLVSVAFYVFVFYEALFVSDMILNVIYVVLQIYGWWYWLRGRREPAAPSAPQVPVTTISPGALAGWIALSAVGTAAWGYGVTTFVPEASVPYPDAFTTVASLIAQWLMARKKLESWYFWIVVDIVSPVLYFHKELHVTAVLYLVFLCLAVSGLFAWRRSMTSATGAAA